jgi:hypothetical protein
VNGGPKIELDQRENLFVFNKLSFWNDEGEGYLVFWVFKMADKGHVCWPLNVGTFVIFKDFFIILKIKIIEIRHFLGHHLL